MLLSALGCSFGQQALFFFPFGERARLIGGLAAIAAQPGESGSHGGFQKSARPTLLQGGPNAAQGDPRNKKALQLVKLQGLGGKCRCLEGVPGN